MKVVRAIQKEDLDDILRLVMHVGDGMTTLKPDKKMLARRINLACDSFAEKIPKEQRDYVFVLEDLLSGEIAGICAIKSTVGLTEAFYNYRIGTLVHSSKELDVYSRMETLYLSNDLTGSSELCSLFLHPDHRDGANGKLLSKSRFLFIAQYPHLFSEKLIAELRGFLRPDGSSPFWDHLGHHFFQMNFDRADNLSSAGKKSFIAELMPRYPLYVTYLPKEAQEVIGEVHVDTVPARRLLEGEGLCFDGFIDIFDGGPVMQTRVSALRSCRSSSLCTIANSVGANNEPGGQPTLVANTNMQDYRVILTQHGPHGPDSGQLVLTSEQQRALGCTSQSEVRTMPLKCDRL